MGVGGFYEAGPGTGAQKQSGSSNPVTAGSQAPKISEHTQRVVPEPIKKQRPAETVLMKKQKDLIQSLQHSLFLRASAVTVFQLPLDVVFASCSHDSLLDSDKISRFVSYVSPGLFLFSYSQHKKTRTRLIKRRLVCKNVNCYHSPKTLWKLLKISVHIGMHDQINKMHRFCCFIRFCRLPTVFFCFS